MNCNMKSKLVNGLSAPALDPSNSQPVVVVARIRRDMQQSTCVHTIEGGGQGAASGRGGSVSGRALAGLLTRSLVTDRRIASIQIIIA